MTKDGENLKVKILNKKHQRLKFKYQKKDLTIKKNVFFLYLELLEKELILDEITNLSEKLRKQAVDGR